MATSESGLANDQDVSLDELGPVDYLVVEFPAGASNFTGEMAKELLALVDSGTIRVIDILILAKTRTVPWRRWSCPTSASSESSRLLEASAGGASGRGRRRAPRRCHGAGSVAER